MTDQLPAIPFTFEEHARPELRVYLAADFARREELNLYAEGLEGEFPWVTVTSRWHRKDDGKVGLGGPDADREKAELVSTRDLEDIDACDLFVVLTTGRDARGGRHFETGYAYATGKKVVVVGLEEHVFHYLPRVAVLRPGTELTAANWGDVNVYAELVRVVKLT